MRKKILISFISVLVILASGGLVYASTISKTPITDSGLRNGLVGHWTFDGDSSRGGANAYSLDKSGNNNTATGVGSPVSTAGKVGQAMKFDGVDDNLTVSNSASVSSTFGGDYTISMWIKAKTDSTIRALWHKTGGGGTTLSYFNYPSAGQVQFLSGSSASADGLSSITTNLNNNKWRHVIFQLQGTTQRIYIDGNLDNSRTKVAGVAAESALIIGSSAPYFFNGSMDDLRVYNRALSLTEIKQLYSMGGSKINTSISRGGLNSGLVGWWTFDGKDVTATKVIDRAGTNNGTRAGGVAMSSGKIGQAGKFDGVDDNLTWSSINAGTTSTFSIWAKGTKDNVTLFSNSNNNGLYFSGTTVYFYVNGVAVTLTTGYTRNNNWHSYVVTRTGTTFQLYIDGVGRGSVEHTQNIAHSVDRITYANWNGSLDDARIYNRALSLTEIKQLYALGGGKIASSPPSITQGLVGWWTFDGADVIATKVLDKAAANHLTRNGGITMNAGKIGQASKYDGVNDFLQKTNFNATQINTGSMGGWFKAGTTQVASARILDVGDGSTNRAVLYFDASGFITMYNQKDGVIIVNIGNSTNLKDNKWHYVVGTWNATEARIYVDGVSVNSVSGDKTLNLGASVNLLIGEYDGGGYFKGTIDDVRVYNRVLSAQEVRQLYNMGK